MVKTSLLQLAAFVSGIGWGLPSSQWSNTAPSIWFLWEIRHFNVSFLPWHITETKEKCKDSPGHWGIFCVVMLIYYKKKCHLCVGYASMSLSTKGKIAHKFMLALLVTERLLLILQQSLQCCLVVSFLRNTLVNLQWHQWPHLIYSPKGSKLMQKNCKRKWG